MGHRVPSDETPESLTWIEQLVEAHSDEILGREIRVQFELDPQFQIGKNSALEAALTGLLRFVFSTVPDGCEVFVASARRLAPVAALGSGSLTFRWQAAGDERCQAREKVTALRPIAGNAQVHVQSIAADQLLGAFEAAGWDFELIALAEDREMWARASTR